jgi:4a-hydroxytetrahydrobiopterin dehydratase
MSEEGWRNFVSTRGLDDWVVLHGGVVAVYRVESIAAASDLASELVPLFDGQDDCILLTLSRQRVTVRLTRDIWAIEHRHVDMARTISSVARTRGAVAERGEAQEVQVAIASHAEDCDVAFWRAVLGYQAAAPDNCVDPLGHGSTVWMQELEIGKKLRHAMHIDVSVSYDSVQERLAAALAAGGRIVDDSHAPSHWTLSDRAGNRVCICAWPDHRS